MLAWVGFYTKPALGFVVYSLARWHVQFWHTYETGTFASSKDPYVPHPTVAVIALSRVLLHGRAAATSAHRFRLVH